MTTLWRLRSLGELSDEELAAMVRENETLFVERKATLDGAGYKVAEAVASFANTLGGWVLVGLNDDGTPNAGQENGWTPIENAALVDRVRQVLEEHLDPIPPFAAAVWAYPGSKEQIGIIRVYESADTPHVLKGGKVVVRSVAQNRRVGAGLEARYEAAGASQATLRDLVDRGRRAQEAQEARIGSRLSPFVRRALGFGLATESDGTVTGHVGAAAVVLATPSTRQRFEDWAVSRAAREALQQAVSRLARSDDQPENLEFEARGMMCTRMTLEPGVALDGFPAAFARAVADSDGVVGCRLIWGDPTPAPEPSRLHLNGLRDLAVLPLLSNAVELLAEAEAYGRATLRLDLIQMARCVVIDDEGGFSPRTLPDITLMGQVDIPVATSSDSGSSALLALANRWRDDVARASGMQRLR